MSAELEARMKEPVAQAMIRHLMVPWVYFDRDWSHLGSRYELVVVDRAGTGDIHLVALKSSFRSALSPATVDHLLSSPGHFYWLAFPRPSEETDYAELPLILDGGGRIGLIEVVETHGRTFGANIIFPAERVHTRIGQEIDEFTRREEPDIRFR